MRFHLCSPLPYRGTGRMGWKSIAPPTLGSVEGALPSEELRLKRANNAHTSESGFESFLPTSARFFWAASGCCPPAPGANETNASRLAANTYDRICCLPAVSCAKRDLDRYDGSVARRAC